MLDLGLAKEVSARIMLFAFLFGDGCILQPPPSTLLYTEQNT